jgi:hypothetical protein
MVSGWVKLSRVKTEGAQNSPKIRAVKTQKTSRFAYIVISFCEGFDDTLALEFPHATSQVTPRQF